MGNKREWMETLITAKEDGAAYGASTAATSIIPTSAICTLPASYYDEGKKLLIEAGGRISNIITTPGTLTLEIRHGAVIVWTSGAMQLNAVAKTNVSWNFGVRLTCRAIGSGTSANLMGIGWFESESVVGSPLPAAGGVGKFILPVSAPAVGTGFDFSAAQAVNLYATWSVNDAGNTLTLHDYHVIALN